MSGFSTIESPVPVQFGVVAIDPFQPLFFFWVSRSLRCSALISGIISGTSASMRWALASLTTVNPASANFDSTCAATSEGSAEKTMSHPFADSGLACLTTFSAIAGVHRVWEEPVHCLAVLLPGRLASHKDLQVQVWVLGEHVDVALPHRARRAEEGGLHLSAFVHFDRNSPLFSAGPIIASFTRP